MFIDYLTLIMINLVAGTALLAYFIATQLKPNKSVAAGFGMVGLLATILGLHVTLSWPLPGSYNILFGEATTLFGIVFLGAALALAAGWDLYPVTLYAFFAGLYAVFAGYLIIAHSMTKDPVLSGIGFILAGLGGVVSPIALRLKDNKTFRLVVLVVLIVTLLLWGTVFFNALGDHVQSFAKWLPATMGK